MSVLHRDYRVYAYSCFDVVSSDKRNTHWQMSASEFLWPDNPGVS